MPGGFVSSRGSAGWKTGRQVLTLQTKSRRQTSNWDQKIELFHLWKNSFPCWCWWNLPLNSCFLKKKNRTKLEIKLKIEFVCSEVELDAWKQGTKTQRQDFSACLSVHTNFAKHPLLPNPTRWFYFDAVTLYSLYTLCKYYKTSTATTSCSTLTAFVIRYHLINHLSLKLSNQK